MVVGFLITEGGWCYVINRSNGKKIIRLGS